MAFRLLKIMGSFRVYFVSHHDGRLTGTLMRTWDFFWDSPLPSAYGESEEEVYSLLELKLQEFALSEDDYLERYIWEESFRTQQVLVEIHPMTVLKKRAVIGEKQIPLKLSYTWCQLRQNGAYRVMLPRFNWWFLLENLDVAPEVLRNAVSSALLGQNPRWVYDFRYEGPEYVREWSPKLLPKVRRKKEEESTPIPPVLESVSEELVEKAYRRKLPALVANTTDVLAPYLSLFQRFPPASILLVGDAGVGKTTFLYRMARLFASWRRDRDKEYVPRIFSTSSDRILAGMVYVGMWQERCLRMVTALSHEGHYLYIDQLSSFMAPQADGSSIADMFAAALASEEISLIVECNSAEFERYSRRHSSFLQHFQIIHISATPPSEMPSLLAEYQAKKGSKFFLHPSSLKRLVLHLEMFQRDHGFPGKGFRFLDWLNQEKTKLREKTLYPTQISEAYARFSGLPLALISDDQPASSEAIANTLKQSIIGQDRACQVSAQVLARFKAGINDPEKPCGSLFFVGPTGVGKTELAKQIARYMFSHENRMIRLDMSEYMLYGSSQRLLAAGKSSNSLAQKVRQQPLSLVLLDEIEKAHPEVFDLLLGILGEGRLTDSLGRLVDFRMTLFVMTSNLGVVESSSSLGFSENASGKFETSVRQYFRPEFFNRIDHVVSFQNLSLQDVTQIVDLELKKTSKRTGLVRRSIRLMVSKEAKLLLARLGYHPTQGARPLKRVIEERIITPVAVKIAKDPGFRNRSVMVLCQKEMEDSASLAERYTLISLDETGSFL